jgi:hypothetical protein
MAGEAEVLGIHVAVPLSTTDPTHLDLGSKPGRCGGKPTIICLSYGTALLIYVYI